MHGLGSDEFFWAHAAFTPSALGDLIHATVHDRREATDQHMMVRFNRPRAFLERIAPWLAARNANHDRAFSMEIAETGEVIGLQFLGGRLVIGDDKLTPHRRVTRARLAGVLLGDHPSRPTEWIDEWNGIGDFYFPIRILDRS